MADTEKKFLVTKPHCYNSWSCVLSVLIILFVLGAIMWDIVVTKPAMKQSIEEIRVEVKDIRNKLDAKLESTDMVEQQDTLYLYKEE